MTITTQFSWQVESLCCIKSKPTQPQRKERSKRAFVWSCVEQRGEKHNSSLSLCKVITVGSDNLRTADERAQSQSPNFEEEGEELWGTLRESLYGYMSFLQVNGVRLCECWWVVWGGGGAKWNEKCTHPIYERCGPGSLLAPLCGPQEGRKTKSVSSLWFFASNGYRWSSFLSDIVVPYSRVRWFKGPSFLFASCCSQTFCKQMQKMITLFFSERFPRSSELIPQL